MTFNGFPLPYLGRDTDGNSDSFMLQNVSGFQSRSDIHFFGLREADLAAMPSPGPMQITFAPGTEFWMMCFARWFFGNCDQSERVRYFGRFSSSAPGTVLGGTVLQGGASDGVVLAGINGSSAGSIQMTVNGGALTENFDLDFVTVTARFAGANFLAGIPAGTTTFDMTYTQPADAFHQAAVIMGVRFAEFFSPTPGARCVVTESLSQTVNVEA